MTEQAVAKRVTVPSVGIVVVIFALIGVFTVIGGCFFATRELISSFSSKQSFERKIFPVVMFDPATFENPNSLREIDLMLYSVWSCMLGENRKSYEVDERQGTTTIPATELDRECFKLFGSSVKLAHKSFSDYENYYRYDENTKSYVVPAINMTAFYYPRVTEILEYGGSVYLKVGYITPQTVMDITFDGSVLEKEPTKYMLYELKLENSNYYIYSIRTMAAIEEVITGGLQPKVGTILDTLRKPTDKNKKEEVYTPADQQQPSAQTELSSQTQGFIPQNSITGIYDMPLPKVENIEIKG